MNKNIVIGILVLVGIFGLAGLYLSSNNSKEVIVKTSPEAPEAIVKVTPEAMMKKEGGKYIEYINPSTLEIKNSKIVLYFYANWCPSCKVANQSLTDNESKIPADTQIIKVNYNDSETDNNEKALAKKYGITYQHTFVQIDENGNEITKWNGGGFEELLSNIK